MVLLDLGRTESFINDRMKECAKLSNDRNEEITGVSTNSEQPGNENSLLLQLLIAPNEVNLGLLTTNDFAVSTFDNCKLRRTVKVIELIVT